ncbi:MAG: DUF456 family protein [Candidatus Acetothermia bacterium]
MAVLAVALFLPISLAGLALLPVGVPGTFVVVGASALAGLLSGGELVGFELFLVFLGLAVLGEILDWTFSLVVGKKYGASAPGLVASFIGAIAGAIAGLPLPLIGNLIGAFLGAFAGAFIVELFLRKDAGQAMKSGLGVMFGKVFGSVFKVGIGTFMIVKVLINFFS